jgi:hypothetical protein
MMAGPDHVTDVFNLFGATAVLLVITELAGIWAGTAALRR